MGGKGEKFFVRVFYFLAPLALFSCSGSPPRPEAAAMSSEQESRCAREMGMRLDQEYGDPSLRASPVVNRFLQHLLSRLSQPGGRGAEPRLHVVKSEELLIGAGLSRTIYVSLGLLKTVRFENELAFLLASQMALIKKQAPQSRLLSMGDERALDSKWFQNGGFFDFGRETYLAADKEAVGMLVAMTYDPRGSLSFLDRMNSKRSPWFRSPLRNVLPPIPDRAEELRNQVAKTSPLRDPIVRSMAFDEFIRALTEGETVKEKKTIVDGNGKSKST